MAQNIQNFTVCCGCGGMFPNMDGPVHRYMESSPACWAAYGEVMAREYSDPQRLVYYRLSVDAYAVQHPGQPSRQTIQSVGVHLIRLCLLLDCGLNMDSANDAMIAASARKHTFTWLTPPAQLGKITVADVVSAQTNEALQEVAWDWAREAWAAWAVYHDTVRAWLPPMAANAFKPKLARRSG
jgi:Family of unknown function (DUF5946)